MNNNTDLLTNQHQFRFFMTEKLMRSVNIEPGLQTLRKLMQDTRVNGYIAFLPDYTPANSLPVGTSFLLDPSQKINPSWIGMDIGCGYNFLELDIDLKKVYKKGKINHNRLQKMVDAIDSVLKPRSNLSYGKVPLTIDGIQTSADRYLGTLGQGNHFIDIFYIDEIIDPKAFKHFKLQEKKVYVLIHSGSRELGFKVHNYFAQQFSAHKDFTDFNADYLNGLHTAIEYARANRRKLAENIAKVLDCDIKEIFDQDHNAIDNCIYRNTRQFRIRKGATLVQQNKPAIIPANCTSPAYLVKPAANIADTYNTLPHGTGRKYTRAQLFAKFARSKRLSDQFKNIMLNVSPKKMIEEVPTGYKPISDILKALTNFKLATPIAKLIPLAVIVDRD